MSDPLEDFFRSNASAHYLLWTTSVVNIFQKFRDYSNPDEDYKWISQSDIIPFLLSGVVQHDGSNRAENLALSEAIVQRLLLSLLNFLIFLKPYYSCLSPSICQNAESAVRFRLRDEIVTIEG